MKFAETVLFHRPFLWGSRVGSGVQTTKALREHQRARLDARHKYVLGLVANRLDLEESAVEDFMLDGEQVAQQLYQQATFSSIVHVKLVYFSG